MPSSLNARVNRFGDRIILYRKERTRITSPHPGKHLLNPRTTSPRRPPFVAKVETPHHGIIERRYIGERRRQRIRAQDVAREARAELARQAVFATVELLEQILLSLPPRDAVVSTRVCKAWNQCLDSSPAAKRHFFLRSSGQLTQQVLWSPGPKTSLFAIREPPTLNLTGAFSASGPSSLPEPQSWNFFFQPTPKLLTPARLCPALRLCQPHQPPLRRLVTEPRENVETCITLEVLGRWKAMLLTDPPCTECWITGTFQHTLYPAFVVTVRTRLVEKSGITLAAAVDAITKRTGRVTCFYPPPWEAVGSEVWEHVTIEDVLREATKAYGGHFDGHLRMGLAGVLVPDEEDWAYIGCRKR